MKRLTAALALTLGLLTGCATSVPEPVTPTSTTWHLGSWRFDLAASRALNRDNSEFVARAEGARDGLLTLEISLTEVILTELLDDRVDTTRLQIRHAAIGEEEVRLELERGRPLVLRREGDVLHFREPTGVTVGFVRAKL